MTIRFKFRKTGCMKYIGHLDLIRLFQKAFRKVDFPIAYSSGYNPHPLLSIAAPLSVGITSSGDYMDVKINENMNECMIDKMNEFLPEGLDFLSYTMLGESQKNAMSIVRAATYQVRLKVLDKMTQENITAYLAQEVILTQKKNKKKITVEVDIKKGIYDLALEKDDLKMVLATGSVLNVKPSFVIKTLCAFLKLNYNPFDYVIHREDLFYLRDGRLISLDT